MSEAKKNLVEMAKIGRKIGLHGYRKLYLFGDIEKYDLLWENGDAVEIDNMKIINEELAHIKISNDKDEYTDRILFSEYDELEELEEDEFYYHDLIGMDVYVDGEVVAKVTDVQDFGGGIVLDTDTKQMLQLDDLELDLEKRAVYPNKFKP